MPKHQAAFDLTRRERAVAEVGEMMSAIPGARALGAAELQAYDLRDPTHGWQLDVAFTDRSRRLDLLILDGFPRRPPRVALVDRPDFLTWPHVEEDGALCLLAENAEIDFTRPADVAKCLLASAADLVQDLADTGRTDDFRSEFNTYWGRAVGLRRPKVYSLLHPVPPSRLIRVWEGRNFSLVGDDEAITAWLSNRFPAGVDTSTAPAAVVWLSRPLLPREFPKTPAHVFALAEGAGQGRLAEQLVVREGGDVVVFAAETVHGPCFAVTTLIGKTQPGQEPATIEGPVRGFRPGKAPRRLLVSRLYGGGTALKSVVERADAAWVHGRGQDARLERLRNATVAVLGCGSVGAPTALQLVGAGVGSIILVDPKTLTWANVGRHPLGAAGVGRGKAEGLADLIRVNHPHIRRAEACDAKWPAVGGDVLQKLADCDLIVSTIGNWAAEAGLNEWHRTGRSGPIVYGWTEAHACAGHAVAIVRPGGCLQCGFAPDGMPRVRVTEWPAGSTIKQEPACGAVFQPYGPIELGHIVSVVAETALDCLMGLVKTPVCRTWVGRRSLLESAGGKWDPDWLAGGAGRERGGFVEEWEWPRTPNCVECGAPAT